MDQNLERIRKLQERGAYYNEQLSEEQRVTAEDMYSDRQMEFVPIGDEKVDKKNETLLKETKEKLKEMLLVDDEMRNELMMEGNTSQKALVAEAEEERIRLQENADATGFKKAKNFFTGNRRSAAREKLAQIASKKRTLENTLSENLIATLQMEEANAFAATKEAPKVKKKEPVVKKPVVQEPVKKETKKSTTRKKQVNASKRIYAGYNDVKPLPAFAERGDFYVGDREVEFSIGKPLPVAIKISNNPDELRAFLAENEDQLDSITKRHLEYRARCLDRIKQMSMPENRNNIIPPDDRVEIKNGAGRTITREEYNALSSQEKLIYSVMLKNVNMTRPQTYSDSCWSCAMEQLFKFRGIDMPQELIRAYRPKGIKTNVDEDKVEEIFSWIQRDAMGSIVEMIDLFMATMKNVAVHTVTLVNDDKQVLDKRIGMLRDMVAEALVSHKSPLTFTDGIHYQVIFGFDDSGVYVKNPYHRIDPEKANETHYYSWESLATLDSIDFAWLEDIDANTTIQNDIVDTNGQKKLTLDENGEFHYNQRIKYMDFGGERVPIPDEEDHGFNQSTQNEGILVMDTAKIHDHKYGTKGNDSFDFVPGVYVPKKLQY